MPRVSRKEVSNVTEIYNVREVFYLMLILETLPRTDFSIHKLNFMFVKLTAR